MADDTNFVPRLDGTGSLGRTDKRWNEVHAKTYHGDGSNLTGVTTDAELTSATGILQANIDNVATASLSSWAEDAAGHLLPVTGATGYPDYEGFDIGNADFKVRHLFLSSNSLWVGDEHKIAIGDDGKMKFRKRKNQLPKELLNAGATPETGASLKRIRELAHQHDLEFEDLFNDSDDFDEESNDAVVAGIQAQVDAINTDAIASNTQTIATNNAAIGAIDTDAIASNTQAIAANNTAIGTEATSRAAADTALQEEVSALPTFADLPTDLGDLTNNAKYLSDAGNGGLHVNINSGRAFAENFEGLVNPSLSPGNPSQNGTWVNGDGDKNGNSFYDAYEWPTTGSSDYHTRGPSSPYSGDTYIFTEASPSTRRNGNNGAWHALTKFIPAAENIVEKLSFYYFGHGVFGPNQDAGLSVYLSETGNPGTGENGWNRADITKDVDGTPSVVDILADEHDSQSEPWKRAEVDLSAYEGKDLYIRLVGNTGGSSNGEFAIDYIDFETKPLALYSANGGVAATEFIGDGSNLLFNGTPAFSALDARLTDAEYRTGHFSTDTYTDKNRLDVDALRVTRIQPSGSYHFSSTAAIEIEDGGYAKFPQGIKYSPSVVPTTAKSAEDNQWLMVAKVTDPGPVTMTYNEGLCMAFLISLTGDEDKDGDTLDSSFVVNVRYSTQDYANAIAQETPVITCEPLNATDLGGFDPTTDLVFNFGCADYDPSPYAQPADWAGGLWIKSKEEGRTCHVSILGGNSETSANGTSGPWHIATDSAWQTELPSTGFTYRDDLYYGRWADKVFRSIDANSLTLAGATLDTSMMYDSVVGETSNLNGKQWIKLAAKPHHLISDSNYSEETSRVSLLVTIADNSSWNDELDSFVITATTNVKALAPGLRLYTNSRVEVDQLSHVTTLNPATDVKMIINDEIVELWLRTTHDHNSSWHKTIVKAKLLANFYEEYEDYPSHPWTVAAGQTGTTSTPESNYNSDSDKTGELSDRVYKSVTAETFIGDGSQLTGLGTFDGDYNNLTNTPDISAMITTAVDDIVDNAPGALNTLNEIAAAIDDDANIATTLTTALTTETTRATAAEDAIVATIDTFYTDSGDIELDHDNANIKLGTFTDNDNSSRIDFIEDGTSGNMTHGAYLHYNGDAPLSEGNGTLSIGTRNGNASDKTVVKIHRNAAEGALTITNDKISMVAIESPTITAITNSVAAEETRATAAEAANASAITAEETRATAAEAANTSAITAEQTRATAAEAANTSAITAEQTRAEAAEEANADEIMMNITRITAEETRAETAEAALQTAIANLGGITLAMRHNHHASISTAHKTLTTSMADLGDGFAEVTFTCPANGMILFESEFFMVDVDVPGVGSSYQAYYGIHDGTDYVTDIDNIKLDQQEFWQSEGENIGLAKVAGVIKKDGSGNNLVPGQSYTFHLHMKSGGSTQHQIYYGANYPPVITKAVTVPNNQQ